MAIQQSKPYIYIGIVIAVTLFVGIFAFNRPSEESGGADYMTPADSFSHAHGLSVDAQDPTKLYVATHNGLFMLENDEELYRIGESQDDFMGFSAHPTGSDTFFASGHGQIGGNLGFQKSGDGGRTWQKVSDGIDGPVDFHAMAVGQVNPEIVYGYYGGLQRSLDGGKNWVIFKADIPDIIFLATDTEDEARVYAATANGLHISTDHGESWKVAVGLDKDPVLTVVVSPDNSRELIAYTPTDGLVKSVDRGNTWKEVDIAVDAPILYLAYSRSQPDIVYAIDQDNGIYKSADGGQNWGKINW